MKFSELVFHDWSGTSEDKLVGCKLVDGGKITVLDRMTGYGYGIRDIETGYCDAAGNFWLASCGFDIRDEAGPDTDVEDVIATIKKFANTCKGDNAPPQKESTL